MSEAIAAVSSKRLCQAIRCINEQQQLTYFNLHEEQGVTVYVPRGLEVV